MAIPYVQECNEAMSIVSSAATDIEEAIQAVRDLVGDATWTGSKADAWETDFSGFATDAENSLGTPLDEAMRQARSNASRWQSESASPGPS